MSDGFSSSDRRPLMEKENLFHLSYESDDEDSTGLTRRFSRSVSLQEPPFNFKVSPETTFGWSGHSPAPAPSDEDAWNLIYDAEGQVARMKMRTSFSNGDTGFVANKSDRGVIGAPWGMSDGEELFRQQHFCRNNCVAAWAPSQLENQRHHPNQHKPVVGFGGSCDGGATASKRECAGTGVFLPRRYCTNAPESRKRQACPPAKMIQSSTATPQIQPRIYEMLMSRRKAMTQQQRSNIHDGVMDNPEVLLPQEWTY